MLLLQIRPITAVYPLSKGKEKGTFACIVHKTLPFLSRYRPLSREDIPQLFGRQIQPYLHTILALRISYIIPRLFVLPCYAAADIGSNIPKKSYRFFPSFMLKVSKMNEMICLETVNQAKHRTTTYKQ